MKTARFNFERTSTASIRRCRARWQKGINPLLGRGLIRYCAGHEAPPGGLRRPRPPGGAAQGTPRGVQRTSEYADRSPWRARDAAGTRSDRELDRATDARLLPDPCRIERQPGFDPDPGVRA